jgi:hypothetical protein
MSILNALKQHNSSIDDLAKLPQAMIMQMAQKKEISSDMVAPILSRKAEMMDAVARSKALQPQPPVPTVMEQIMAKNIQAEHPQPQGMPQAAPQGMPQVAPQSPMQGPMPTSPDQVGVGQLPVPERQYAGGGIIAFKRGDLVDLEDDMDEEDLIAEYADAMKAGEMAMARNAESNPSMQGNAGTGMKYSEPMPSGASKGINYQGGKHPYESLVMDKAKEHGVDPMLAAYILNKETGGMKNPENARSSAGAMGIAQFMPATAKQYGINPDIPEEAASGMGKHLSHLMNKFHDPKVAAIAYNWGEGNTQKWLNSGADMSKLPKETQKYVASLAQGGEIRHFANDGYVDSEDNRSSFQQDLIDTFGYSGAASKSPEKPEYLTKAVDYFTKPKNRVGKTSYIPNVDSNLDNRDVGLREVAPIPVPSNQDFQNFDQAAALFQAEQGAKRPQQVAPPEQTYWDKVMSQMGEDRADLAKSRADSKNMALLAAGLGMMGGTSPYAFANIGQGGLHGVQYLSEANKQHAAEKAALDKNMLVAQRYKELGETAKGNQAGLMAIRQGELDVSRGKLTEAERAHNLNTLSQLEKNSQTRALAALKVDAMAPLDPNTQAKINQWVAQDLASKKEYNKLYQDVYGFPYDIAPSPTAGGNVIRYDSKGKEIK